VHVFALLAILLSVEEPVGDVELAGVLNHGLDGFNLLLGQLTGSLGQVDVGLLADHGGEATTASLDFGQSERNSVTTIHVRVQDTQNVLKVIVFDNPFFI